MRVALALWYVAWFVVGFPWRSFRSQPSWERVQLIPFAGGSLRSHVLNVLAFVPLGVIASRLQWRPEMVVLVGVCTSAVTELLQLFSARRYPSTTDVVLNTVGTVIGLLLMRRISEHRSES